MTETTGKTNYNDFVDLIKRFEAKYKRQMTIQELATYLQELRKIKLELAKQYIKDLAELGKIQIEYPNIKLLEKKKGEL